MRAAVIINQSNLEGITFGSAKVAKGETLDELIDHIFEIGGKSKSLEVTVFMSQGVSREEIYTRLKERKGKFL